MPRGEGLRQIFATLQEEEIANRTSDQFNGRPFSRRWKTPMLYYDKPLLPRPDFCNYGPCAFVCNERALFWARGLMEECGECLPVTVEGGTGEYCIYHVTNCLNVLDAEKSQWKPYGPRGEYKTLRKPFFRANRLGEDWLFKIAENAGTETYCLEHTGEPDADEFKAIVEQQGPHGSQV